MLSAIFYLAMAAWAAWYLRGYRVTRDKAHLQSAGTLLLVITFFAALGRGWDAVLYPGQAWRVYAVLLPGAAAGGLLLAAGYPGWRKVFAAGQVLVFIAFTAFFSESLVYFKKMRVHQHAGEQAAKLVPGIPKDFTALNDAEKAELAARLIKALPDAADVYARAGIMNKLAYIPAWAGPAMPALLPLIAPAGDYELEAILILLKAMGPEAAAALPALNERLQKADLAGRYRLEEAIKAITPAPGPRNT